MKPNKSIRAALIAALPLSLLPSALHAEPKPRVFPEITIEEGLKAYQDICVAHVGDNPGQIAAAKAAPYAMIYARGPDGDITYDNERMFAAFRNDGGKQFCMVGLHVADNPDEKGIAAQLEKTFPAGVIRLQEQPGQYGWANPATKPLTIYMYMQQTKANYAITSFMIGVVTK